METAGFRCYYLDCRKHFLSKYNLTRHVNTAHLEIKPFVCPRCSWQCSSKQNLNSHLRTHIKRLKRGEEDSSEDVPRQIRELEKTIKDKDYGLTDRQDDDLPEIHPSRQQTGQIPLCPGLLQKP